MPLPASQEPPQQHAAVMQALCVAASAAVPTSSPQRRTPVSGWPQLTKSHLQPVVLDHVQRQWNAGELPIPGIAGQHSGHASTHGGSSPLRKLSVAVARHLTARHARQAHAAQATPPAATANNGISRLHASQSSHVNSMSPLPSLSPVRQLPAQTSTCVLLSSGRSNDSHQSKQKDVDGDVLL